MSKPMLVCAVPHNAAKQQHQNHIQQPKVSNHMPLYCCTAASCMVTRMQKQNAAAKHH
jgi:hypothetical protein